MRFLAVFFGREFFTGRVFFPEPSSVRFVFFKVSAFSCSRAVLTGVLVKMADFRVLPFRFVFFRGAAFGWGRICSKIDVDADESSTKLSATKWYINFNS